MKHIYMTETCQKTLAKRPCGKKKEGCFVSTPEQGTFDGGGGYWASRSVGRAGDASGSSVLAAAGEGAGALASLASRRANNAARPACCGSYTPHSSFAGRARD